MEKLDLAPIDDRAGAAAEPKQRRPGGRTERVRKAVADAVLSLVRDSGMDFGVEEVVQLSGVGRATLFRRWPDRASLIGEALAEHTSRFEVPISDNWKDHLYAVAEALDAFFQDPVEQRFNHAMLSPQNHLLNEKILYYWTPVIQTIRRPLDNAVKNREIGQNVDVDMVVMSLISMLLVNSLLGNHASRGAARAIVDQICRGVPAQG